MPDRARLLALAEECERAAGSSLALDKRISVAMGRGRVPRYYTTSLDAAMSLVPKGLYWLVGAGKTRPDEPLFGAQILRGQTVVAGGETGASAAAALCASALRALAEEASDV